MSSMHDNLIQKQDDDPVLELVGLKLGEEEYALDVLKIQEIIRNVEFTFVPKADPYVLGVMNMRGKVIPVYDMRIRFKLEKANFDKATSIIVTRFDKSNIGFVVDEVTEVIRINRKEIEPAPPLVGSVGQEYILGICKFNSRLIMVLDIDAIAGVKEEDSFLKKIISGKGLPTAAAPAAIEAAPKAEAAKPAEMAKPVVEAGGDEELSIDEQIARELAKREAETRELNANKSQDGGSAPAEDGAALPAPAADEANLSIEDRIAQELAKREAETRALNENKKKVV